MPSVTSVTESMVASTGCLIDSSLRNTVRLARRDRRTLGDLDALLGHDQVAALEPGQNLGVAVALAAYLDRAPRRFAVLDDEHSGVLCRLIVAIERRDWRYDR